MNTAYDAGKDGQAGYLVSNPNEHKNTAIDIASYTLGYFGGDYKAINTASQFEASYSGFGFDLAANNLYNGNIRSLVTSINGMNSLGTAYRYDQLQRLKSMTAFDWNTSPAVNSWLNVAATTDYFNSYTYDKNGNILNLQRNGVASPMDNFTYNYTTVSGQPSNRLGYVGDVVGAGNYPDDIDNQSTGNYSYDKLGQLKSDVAEGILEIEWRSGDKKIKRLKRDNLNGAGKPNLEFIYNPFGQRIIKIVKLNPGTTEDWKYTYYTYDANGQVMAMYDVDLSTALKKATLSEHHLYGASRLGMRKADRVLYNNAVVNYPTLDVQQHKAGIINYEITNYLGNVNAVITDRKTWNAAGVYFEAVSLMKCDYYPFGMEMPGRKITTDNYRYGYNGMEKDDEVKGEGNSYTTEFRQYDPRLGRWLSLDPLMHMFPSMSPYVAFDNNPIYFTDPFGLSSQEPIERTGDMNSDSEKQFRKETVQKILQEGGKSGDIVFIYKNVKNGENVGDVTFTYTVSENIVAEHWHHSNQKIAHSFGSSQKFLAITPILSEKTLAQEKTTLPEVTETESQAGNEKKVDEIDKGIKKEDIVIDEDKKSDTKKTDVKKTDVKKTDDKKNDTKKNEVTYTIDAHFTPNTAILNNEAEIKKRLIALAEQLKQNPSATLDVYGNIGDPTSKWTDPVDASPGNFFPSITVQQLAINRAWAVGNLLIKYGAKRSQIKCHSGTLGAGYNATAVIKL